MAKRVKLVGALRRARHQSPRWRDLASFVTGEVIDVNGGAYFT
jgi:hypothetical protein